MLGTMAVDIPETRYARSGDVNIAYQVVGEGPFDLVFVPPFASHVELVWELPLRAALNRALATFSRLIIFDKRGSGLSDPVDSQATIEERMDDVRAVLDAVGSTQAGVFAGGDGCLIASLFAATYPERCFGLALFGPFARSLWAPDYPIGETREDAERSLREIESGWGTQEHADKLLARVAGEANDDLRRRWLSFLRNTASPRAAAGYYRSIYETDIRGVLPLISAPTLVLYREGADWQPEAGRYVADRMPTARVHVLPGAALGPWPNEELGVPAVAAVEMFMREAWETRAESEPDRVLTTVLFTDIVDSTARAVELGDTRWRELVAEHHRRVRRELARFRGRELDTAGDGFFASFDGPARAIRCACAVRDAVADIGVEIRAGLHTGECEHLDGKVAGIAVVTGARIAGVGGSGDVLVSATVRDLVAGSGLAFEDRGLHELKGLPEARQLFAVV
jgi:class 3 adenylate cyclase/pimeloyl-ACP methyl ester carboxylesterase